MVTEVVFRVLGPVAHRVHGEWKVPGGRIQQTLLGVLLAHAGHRVDTDTLGESVWGEAVGDRAAGRLQVNVSRLRQQLQDPGRLVSEHGGYRLEVRPGELDSTVFEELADRARSLSPDDPGRVRWGTQALSLWQSDPFAGLSDPECRLEADRLGEARTATQEAVLEGRLTQQGASEALPDLTVLARRHPLREGLQALLITALAQAGRQDEALAAYRRTYRTLVDELGVEPSDELRTLHEQVLAGAVLKPGREPGADLPVPSQLPAAPGRLVGRDGVLAELDRLLLDGDAGDAGPRVGILTGTAGVGKTATATAWAHRNRAAFPDGQMFTDLRGFSPGEPAGVDDVLDSLLRALRQDPAPLRSTAERSALLRSAFAGRRLFLLLDNAESAEQVRPLLPGTPGSVVLVTSRHTLPGLVARDGAARAELALLDPADAEALLSDLLGERAGDQGDLVELSRRCAFLPLALRVAAERVRGDGVPTSDRSHSGNGPPADSSADLDLIDLGDDPTGNARVVFSWSYRALGGDAARLFRAFGLLPGPVSDVEALAVLTDSPSSRVAAALTDLVRANLVDRDRDRYSQHDLLRAYAADLAKTTDAEWSEEARSRLRRHYLRRAVQCTTLLGRLEPDDLPAVLRADPPEAELAPPEPDPGVWLDRELENLLVLARQARTSGSPEDARWILPLSQVLHRHLWLGGRHHQATTLHTAVRDLAQDVGDLTAEAAAEFGLAQLVTARGEPDESERTTSRALELAREVGREDWVGRLFNFIGVAASQRGDLVEASGYVRRAHRELAELGHPEAVRAQLNVALVHSYALEHDEAWATVTQAVRAARSHGAGTREVLSFALLCQAQAALRAGEAEAAEAPLTEAADLIEEFGLRLHEGDLYELRGTLYLELGRREEAVEHFRLAEQEGRRLPRADRLGTALIGLARTLSPEDPAGATRAFEEGLAVLRTSGIRVLEAEGRAYAAAHLQEQGDLRGARWHLRRERELGVRPARRGPAAVEERLAVLERLTAS